MTRLVNKVWLAALTASVVFFALHTKTQADDKAGCNPGNVCNLVTALQTQVANQQNQITALQQNGLKTDFMTGGFQPSSSGVSGLLKQYPGPLKGALVLVLPPASGGAPTAKVIIPGVSDPWISPHDVYRHA